VSHRHPGSASWEYVTTKLDQEVALDFGPTSRALQRLSRASTRTRPPATPCTDHSRPRPSARVGRAAALAQSGLTLSDVRHRLRIDSTPRCFHSSRAVRSLLDQLLRQAHRAETDPVRDLESSRSHRQRTRSTCSRDLRVHREDTSTGVSTTGQRRIDARVNITVRQSVFSLAVRSAPPGIALILGSGPTTSSATSSPPEFARCARTSTLSTSPVDDQLGPLAGFQSPHRHPYAQEAPRDPPRTSPTARGEASFRRSIVADVELRGVQYAYREREPGLPMCRSAFSAVKSLDVGRRRGQVDAGLLCRGFLIQSEAPSARWSRPRP